MHRLTPKEKEVVKLACYGLSNKHIAEKLLVTEGTVKVHLHSVFGKLEISNRTMLVKFLMENRASENQDMPAM